MTDYHVGQVVVMKKGHPCGANRWEILRIGMDVRIKCQQCKRSLLIPRARFVRRVKAILKEE